MKFLIIIIVLIVHTNASLGPPRKIKSDINDRIAKLEELIKCELRVTSGYRTEKHNRRVGGVKRSYHLYDLARDLVKTRGCAISYYQIGIVAEKNYLFRGIIVYKDHIHLDLRVSKFVWIYD